MAKSAKQPIERVFRGTQQFYHDLFKLRVSTMLKWVGWKQDSKEWFKHPQTGEKNRDWLELEHTHIFHTINSNGAMQKYCAPVGGHFHEMKVVRDPDDRSKIIEVICDSGPLKFEKKKIAGRLEKVAVPVTEFDKHSHKTDYVRSDEIRRKELTPEAAAIISADANRLNKPVTDESGKRLAPLAVK